ncbi:hypothetical protein [Achromobacter kerstersii]|uniref:Uncharacterized protein n=1 Tax=Achromobacter kerstersii TaxID=1353890 RepID=A0A6S6ZHC6_9BURK|nr:hypothetical protein [Achromobacter kerstersii]CAB3680362.1 hypothetical protein LMG3441_01558 [Achromobacter kerstersii]
MSYNENNEASSGIATKVAAQRLAISFLACAVGELFDDAGRKRLQEKLARRAEEAEMRGAEDLYDETASLLRLMAARVGDTASR